MEGYTWPGDTKSLATAALTHYIVGRSQSGWSLVWFCFVLFTGSEVDRCVHDDIRWRYVAMRNAFGVN